MKRAKFGSLILALAFAVSSAGTAAAQGIDNVYALLSNDGDAVKSETVTVEITAPVSGSTVYSGHAVTVEALAEAPTPGEIEKVEFYRDGASEPFASDNTAPYTGITTAGAEDFTVTARAYTKDGLYNEDTVRIYIGSPQEEEQIVYLDADFNDGQIPQNMVLNGMKETAEIMDIPSELQDETHSGKAVFVKNINGGGAPLVDYYNPEQPLSDTVVIKTSVLTDASPWPASSANWFQFIDSSDQEVSPLLELNNTDINSYYDIDKDNLRKRNTIVKGFQANTWYDLEFEIDFNTLTYSISVNGENKGLNLRLPFSYTKEEQYKKITRIRTRFGAQGYGLYIADWSIVSKQTEQNEVVPPYTDENFDAALSMPTNYYGGSGTATVAPSPTDKDGNTRPGNSLYATAQSGAPWVDYYNKSNPITGTVALEADLFLTDTEYPNGIELFYLISETKGNIERLAKVENSDITLWDSAKRISTIEKGFEAKRWYHFKYIINTDAMTYTMELDGIPKTESPIKIAKTSMEDWCRVRFRMAGNGETETGFYVDNFKIYPIVSTQVNGAVFTSDSGVMSVDRASAPARMRKITVDFSAAMDADTLDGVTLTEKESGNTVECTAEYNSDTYQYMVMPQNALQPDITYVLTVPATVKGADGIALSAERITFTVNREKVNVNHIALNGANGAELDKSNTGGSMQAVVDLSSNSDTAEKVCVIVGTFKDGKMIKYAVKTTNEIAAGETARIALTLTEVAENIADETVRVFVWKNLQELYPLCEPFEK